MSTTRRTAPLNRLLAGLPGEVLQRLLGQCESVELEYGAVLHEPEARIEQVYFPTQCFVSLMVPVQAKFYLEVGLIGNEGLLGASLMLGGRISPLRAQVQGAGAAWRMNAATFAQELDRNPMLQHLLLRYLHARMGQLAQAVVCARFHVVERRLARWLLMTQDRAHADEFHVTHARLAALMGVRRVGITTAAHALQERKLIRYHRGEVTILNRLGMQAVSCPCYQADCETYDSALSTA